jgi:Protein of unknown function (DUF3592)
MHFSISGLEVGAGTFAIALLGYFCWELGRLWFALRSEFWPFVTGTIEEVEIDNRRDSDGDDFFVPRIRYVYNVAGESYVGKRLAFRPKGSPKYQEVKAALDGVTATKPLRVYYHPKLPYISVLKPGPRLANYIVLMIVLLMAFVAFSFYASHSN